MKILQQAPGRLGLPKLIWAAQEQQESRLRA